MTDHELLAEAIAEARACPAEGDLPIGAVLADGSGTILARGHNQRVQTGDPTAHAEIVCIRNAGRRRDWRRLTLVSTLGPCVMCSGATLLLRIPRVLVGETVNYKGEVDLLRERGVEVVVLDDDRCVELMRDFTRDHPDLWHEDIGE